MEIGQEEARQIGRAIHAAGGFSLMQEIAHRVRDLGKQRDQPHALGYVERWWNGIDEWRA